MSGASINIRVDPGRIPQALDRLLAAATDLSPALKNIGEYGRQSTIDRIRDGRTPAGEPFAPLNELYAKTKKGPGILRGESGDLASIVYQLADDSVAWGNDIPHGAIHQFGGTIKPKNAAALMFSMGGQTFMVESVTIPARPYLGINAEDEAEILAIMADHFGTGAINDGSD